MSSYTVAGSADNEDTAFCETIANEIKKFYKNIDFRIIIKHPKEWEEYIHEICRTYGFKRKINPIIFTLDGKLIGGIDQFKEMAEYKFGIDTTSLKSVITTKINMNQVEKEVAAKKKLKKGKRTLQEKIQDSLKQKYEDSTLHPVKGIFLSDINEGLQFYVKYEERLCPEVKIDPEQISHVVKEEVLPAVVDIQQIAANDNYPPEINEEEVEKSLAGSKKHQTDNSQIGITPRDIKAINTPRDIKSRETEAAKTKSDFGTNANKESQNQIEEPPQQSNAEIQNPTQQNIPSTVMEGEEQNQPSLVDATQPAIQETSNQIQEEVVEVKKEKQNKNVIVEEVMSVDSEIAPEIFNLAPYIIKKMKDTNYYLSFHPYPLFDGQVILFEKYPNLNPDDYKIENEEVKVEQAQSHLNQQSNVSNSHISGNNNHQNHDSHAQQIHHNEEHSNHNNNQGADTHHDEQASQQQNFSVEQEYIEQEQNSIDILFENNKKLLLDPQAINIIDFSRTQRDRKLRENGKKQRELYIEQQKKIKEDADKEKEKEQNLEDQNNQHVGNILDEEELLIAPTDYEFKSRCSRDWVDINKPLSKQDWKIISKVMKKICCIITYQVLPFGYKTHLPLSTGVVNLFLRKFMNSTHTNQSIIPHLSDQLNEQEPQITNLPFEQSILFDKPKARKVKSYYTIPSLQFEHAIYYFKDQKIKKKKLIKKYRKIVNALCVHPEDKLKIGINLIVTRQFMLVVPLRKPYSYFNNTPLFLHPLAYLGYLHLPKLVQKWPTTAYQIEDLTSSLERLAISTKSY
ncbi:hypothetical protein ABPG74_007556 [Tetrahymena malaccensis]